MRIDILTLFPAAVNAMMSSSILGRAAARDIIKINCVQIRDFTTNRQQQVDDYPYGGGWGCVMMAQPLKACLDHVTAEAGPDCRRRVIYMSPQGKRFDQTEARRLVNDYDHIVLVCGHYEGVDERFIELCCDEEMSVGDFVLTGGEIPAMAIADSVCRMVPGVLSDPACYEGESHWDGLLEYPQYTRPEEWEGLSVPEVLRCGNHKEVAAWRREQQLIRTSEKRPDMFAAFQPQTKEEKAVYLRLTGREPLRYDCRLATAGDMDALLAIAADARAFMKECGVNQWQNGYPSEEDFAEDIERGALWLFTHEEEPAGCVAVCPWPEADYESLIGRWLTEGDGYGAIHRVAVRKPYRSRGLAREMMQLGEDLLRARGYASVRIDTHRNNTAMRKMLEKRGFSCCGELRLSTAIEPDPWRVGYEKVF